MTKSTSWAREKGREARLEALHNLIIREGPLHFFEILERLRPKISRTTLSEDLKELRGRMLVTQVPISGPGKGGPPYVALSREEAEAQAFRASMAALHGAGLKRSDLKGKRIGLRERWVREVVAEVVEDPEGVG